MHEGKRVPGVLCTVTFLLTLIRILKLTTPLTFLFSQFYISSSTPLLSIAVKPSPVALCHFVLFFTFSFTPLSAVYRVFLLLLVSCSSDSCAVRLQAPVPRAHGNVYRSAHVRAGGRGGRASPVLICNIQNGVYDYHIHPFVHRSVPVWHVGVVCSKRYSRVVKELELREHWGR